MAGNYHKFETSKRFLFLVVLTTVLLGCTQLSKTSNASADSKVEGKPIVTYLNSDGPNQGLSAYDLIRDFGGPRPIESPDLFPENHPGVEHIFERTDSIVGHHFVFTIHKNEDKDRDKYIKFGDRQRNEIKAYSKSHNKLKGYEGETMSYSWKFKVGEGMTVSKNFAHFFQLKSVDDGIGTPILTLSAKKRRGEENLILSHSPIKKAQFLATYPWQAVQGKWLQAHCKVTYGNEGRLSFELSEFQSGKQIMSFSSDNIDVWRGTEDEHFVRPKWGIYRSLKTKHMLREQEEQVSFADFVVRKH